MSYLPVYQPLTPDTGWQLRSCLALKIPVWKHGGPIVGFQEVWASCPFSFSAGWPAACPWHLRSGRGWLIVSAKSHCMTLSLRRICISSWVQSRFEKWNGPSHLPDGNAEMMCLDLLTSLTHSVSGKQQNQLTPSPSGQLSSMSILGNTMFRRTLWSFEPYDKKSFDWNIFVYN